MTHALIDTFGRRLDYLRISVTDRCNFRCIYCMPPEGIETIPKEGILSFEEIVRVAKIFMEMGGKRIRLTGGEPLLRKNIVELVHSLSLLAPRPTLALTTNGSLLPELAAPLKEAGLDRINISFDSMNPCRFRELTFSDSYEQTYKGIEAACEAKLFTKLNVVVLQGMSEHEMVSFATLAIERSLEVRFIEFMPLCGTGWHPEWMLPLQTVKEVIRKRYHLTPIARGSEVAESYALDGSSGRVGFIASMTEPFCKRCSRLRLTADGKLRPCLFSYEEVDLRPLLRCGGSDEHLKNAFRCATRKKPEGHGSNPVTVRGVTMPRIRALGG